MKSVHSKIKTTRLLRGRKLAEVAAECGISQPQLGRLERGERRLSVDMLLRIARALEVDPVELLPDDDDEQHAA